MLMLCVYYGVKVALAVIKLILHALMESIVCFSTTVFQVS